MKGDKWYEIEEFDDGSLQISKDRLSYLEEIKFGAKRKRFKEL